MKYYDFIDNEEEKAIKRAIEDETENVLHGVLVCNIDNFIIVNEMYGRSTGDKILAQVQDAMRKLFRSNDLIVKLRGDEFIIFNRNIQALSNMELLANKLLNAISSICVRDAFQLTASVGVSIYPLHGSEYVELKNKAYQAMYKAKANGRNGYRLYDSARTKSVYHDFVVNKKKFQAASDEGSFDFMGDKSYQDVCTEMFRADRDALSALTSILEISCIYLGFSRAYCYTKNIQDEASLKKLMYANSGYEFGKESEAMKLLREDMICRLSEQYQTLTLVNTDDDSLDEDVRSYLEIVGISQLLYFPVIRDGSFAGAVIFDNLDDDLVEFSFEELNSLSEQMHSIQSYFYSAYEKSNSSDNLTKLELFENLDACVYIIDSKEHIIEFTNRKAKLLDTTNRIGQKCYEVFANRSAACEDCPLKRMNVDDLTSNASENMFNFAIGKWCRNLYSWMDTGDNKGKAIMLSVDVDEFFMNIK